MPLLSSSKESNIRENLASSSDSNTHGKGYPSAAHKTSLGDGRVRHPASLSSFGDRIFSLYMQIHRRVKNLIISPTNQVQPPASPASSAHPSAPYPEATPSDLSPPDTASIHLPSSVTALMHRHNELVDTTTCEHIQHPRVAEDGKID